MWREAENQQTRITDVLQSGNGISDTTVYGQDNPYILYKIERKQISIY